MNNTSKNYETFADMINDLGLAAEQVLKLFTEYHGLQLITDDFIEFINNEILPD